MRQKDKTSINQKARDALGNSFCICYVGERVMSDGSTTWDSEKSVDTYDNSYRLRDFKLPSSEWTGTLDIWVYSYESIRDLSEGCEELEFNLAAKFKDGRLVSVNY